MNNLPEVTDLETIRRRSGYQSLEPVTRPPFWGVDRDLKRRPGVPMLRDPRPWPNTRWPPAQQLGEPSTPKHGRTNRPMTPVFSTAIPLHGASGAVRKFAARFPDHKPSYWLTKMLADRVDSWTYRAKKALPFAVPLIGSAVVARRRSLRT